MDEKIDRRYAKEIRTDGHEDTIKENHRGTKKICFKTVKLASDSPPPPRYKTIDIGCKVKLYIICVIISIRAL